MDSARFIRRRQVLISWIGTPILLIMLIQMTGHSLMEQQKLTLVRTKMLEQVIPKISQATSTFRDFIRPYKTEKNIQRSIEDEKIGLLNDAAEKAEVTITSINLTQGILDKSTGTYRINMHVQALGTDQGLATFMNAIRAEDPFIYETQVIISRTGFDDSGLQLEAILSQIYIDRSQGES